MHSMLRYVILIVGILAIIRMAKGMSSNATFTDKDRKPGLFFLITMDLQLVIGLVLYFAGNFGMNLINELGMAEVMKQGITRFFAMEHVIGMLVAIVFVHIGYSKSKNKNLSDQKRFKSAFYLYLIAYILLLAFIPWPFREALGRGWMPGM